MKFCSTELHKEHSNIYDAFFASHATVVSAPLTMRRASIGLMEKDMIPTIFSQLPLRLYLGVHPSSEPGIHFGTVQTYTFPQCSFTSLSADIRESKLPQLAEEIGTYIANDKQGYICDILLECDKFTGTGVYAALCACCAQWVQDTNKDQEIVDLTKIFEKIFKGSYASSDRALALTASTPFVVIDGSAVKEFESAVIPFDVAMVYSGVPGDIRRKPQTQIRTEEKLHAYDVLLNSFFKQVTTHKHTLKFSQHIAQLLQALQAIFNAQVVEKLEEGEPTQDITDIVSTQHLIEQLQAYVHQGDHFLHQVNELSCHEEIGYGIMPLFTGIKGGSYLVSMPFGLKRARLYEMVEQLRTHFPAIHIIWQSRDEMPTAPLAIDQNLIANTRSTRTKDDSIVYSNNQGVREIGTIQELRKKWGDTGLLLDTIERKIYANGEKLTSKHFESQTTTIELLEKCLERLGEPIANEDLSYSTLTRQYNQFLGKIIAPLKKVSRAFFSHEIDIETHGTLREFTIQLNEKKVRIGLLKKI